MHEQLTAEIKQYARRLGFDLVGIAPAEPSKYRQYFRDWLDSGKAGQMEWLQRRFDERTDPAVYLPGARSVICIAMNYHASDVGWASPTTVKAVGGAHPTSAKVARYALGDDYHEVIKSRLHA